MVLRYKLFGVIGINENYQHGFFCQADTTYDVVTVVDYLMVTPGALFFGENCQTHFDTTYHTYHIHSSIVSYIHTTLKCLITGTG